MFTSNKRKKKKNLCVQIFITFVSSVFLFLDYCNIGEKLFNYVDGKQGS